MTARPIFNVSLIDSKGKIVEVVKNQIKRKFLDEFMDEFVFAVKNFKWNWF